MKAVAFPVLCVLLMALAWLSQPVPYQPTPHNSHQFIVGRLCDP